MIEKVIKILEQSGFPNSLDIRVTYTHSGVKVNISYILGSDKQKHPFPALRGALMNALESYRDNLTDSIKSIKSRLDEGFHTDNNLYKKQLMDWQYMYEKMLPYVEESIQYVMYFG
jgi:hypothetical protein